jgi:hypothetical protein
MAKVFDGIKVFSASDYQRRTALGEEVCAWLAERPHIEVVEITVKQSSDRTHHCLTFCIFYKERVVSAAGEERGRRAPRARVRAPRA